MQSHTSHSSLEHDHDSFLDIVANIVGILIILVMVVSMRARHAPDPTDATPTAPIPNRKIEIDHAALQQDLARLIVESEKLDDYLAVRHEERRRLTLLLAATEDRLSEERQRMTEAERSAHTLHAEISQTQQQLADLQLEHIQAASTDSDVQVLENHPTPIGKSVFGREVHFQLLAGRITHLPIETLFREAREQARQKVWKLDKLPESTETVGPHGGFRMRYTLEKIPLPREVRMESGRTGFMIRSKLWELIPSSNQLGEPITAALGEHSRFRRHLTDLDPETTTITLWTYPDSFTVFRTVKKELHAMGFDAAARPLPSGVRIAGSPSGSRSTAQ